jgi:hypothetical protein
MITEVMGRTGRRLAGAAAILAAVGVAAAPQPAHAVSPLAAAGIGLGAFAVGSAIAAPYYWGGYPGYYGYPAYYYAPPAPTPYYPYPRSCWNPYYRTYVAC